MKKSFSISIAFLVIVAGLHLTFAVHYCGGTYAATKISVSGELASCGMEGVEDNCSSPGEHLKSHCCDNEVMVYSVDNNYSPSFTALTDVSQNLLHTLLVPGNVTAPSFFFSKKQATGYFPPGKNCFNEISLFDICVFRI